MMKKEETKPYQHLDKGSRHTPMCIKTPCLEIFSFSLMPPSFSTSCVPFSDMAQDHYSDIISDSSDHFSNIFNNIFNIKFKSSDFYLQSFKNILCGELYEFGI